jgi:hypothetical protein
MRPTFAACVLAAAGCGPGDPELAAVEGVVTVGGRPVANLEVVFLPDAGTRGRDVAAYTDAAGRYRIPHDPAAKVGVPVGVHRVLVRDADLYLVPPSAGVDPASGEPTGAGKPAGPRKVSRVALTYGDAAQTPLRDVRVGPGSQTYDIAADAK